MTSSSLTGAAPRSVAFCRATSSATADEVCAAVAFESAASDFFLRARTSRLREMPNPAISVKNAVNATSATTPSATIGGSEAVICRQTSTTSPSVATFSLQTREL